MHKAFFTKDTYGILSISMIITYHGKQFFKIQQGETVVAYNPISTDAKVPFKVSRFGADIVLSSLNHLDSNGFDTASFGDKVPVIINGPGDYEVKEIFIKGNLSRTKKDGKEYINTIYSMNLEDITVLFLGTIDHALDAKEREGFASPDIIVVPVGSDTLDPALAYKIAVSFEPSIIIPVGDDEKMMKQFAKEAGAPDVKPLDKLVIKKKDLNGKVGEVVLLEM
jgi:L-ascorbate metabolism protein UlaG (beta-lactamase superfamily)